jgi:hypothetical protein
MFNCTFYNLCFFLYVWIVPVFLQYLMRAPSTFDSAPFYPVPMRTLNGDAAHLYMSAFPQTTAAGVAHCRPCQEDVNHKTGMYQWDIMLSMSHQDLINHTSAKQISTMYPVIFASNDFRSWKVVADADDVAQPGTSKKREPTHISAPLLVSNLKDFGCVESDAPTGRQDPWMNQFETEAEANRYRWRLVEHVSMHGSVSLVACVMHGMDEVNHLTHSYATECVNGGILGSEARCHLTARQALSKCFALGSACGQACGYFSSSTPHCMGGTLDSALFNGLTTRRVTIKTSPGGGGGADALVYCEGKGCKSGMHFKDMYVEADNPNEFYEAETDLKRQGKYGGFYAVMLALSDSEGVSHDVFAFKNRTKNHTKNHTKEHGHGNHSSHKDGHGHKRGNSSGEDHKEDDKEANATAEERSRPKRVCVDLPGVRLDEVPSTGLVEKAGEKQAVDPKECSARCRDRIECAQSIFSTGNSGCYLFKMATVQVVEFSEIYNSSYCSDREALHLLMTMLHKAYGSAPLKTPAPTPAPNAPGSPAGLPAMDAQSPLRRRLFAAADGDNIGMADTTADTGSTLLYEDIGAIEPKFFWQIAHVPNLTMGVFKDEGSASVRVIPRNRSCFTTPGFVYMVACMTAKPVYMNGRGGDLDPPPFNDRCLAVGGLCGATCGSSQEPDMEAASHCPIGPGVGKRRLGISSGNPYQSAQIPRDDLVQTIEPKRSATSPNFAARAFFHLFVFFVMISYIATILSKFPGNFTDFYPMHTWDEIKTHGYLLEKFGCAVSCGCSAFEGKMIVFRNWVGKIAARPHFDDTAFPTFGRWVDVFTDEGHREGARIMWVAWTDFLDTNPPVEFLEEWSENLRELTWEQVSTRSPFDLSWSDGGVFRQVLPVVVEQASHFRQVSAHHSSSSALGDVVCDGDVAFDGGVKLQQDSLVKLLDLYNVFKALPDNLKMEPALPQKDDCILTRELALGISEDAGQKAMGCFLIPWSRNWEEDMRKKIQERAQQLGSTKSEYEKSVLVTDKNGCLVLLFDRRESLDASPDESLFPLHFREPPARRDRKVIMVYCARAKPETDRKGIEKTRSLDKYLWACLRPTAVRSRLLSRFQHIKKAAAGEDEKNPLLRDMGSPREDTSDTTWSSSVSSMGLADFGSTVEGVVERQRKIFLASLSERQISTSKKNIGSALHRQYAEGYLKYRRVDSDWEAARCCYGEIVGEDIDEEGEEVLILDNPSPALLELVSDAQSEAASRGLSRASPGMGLVSVEQVHEKHTWLGSSTVSRINYAQTPNLEFVFTNINTLVDSSFKDFEWEFRSLLRSNLAEQTKDFDKLQLQHRERAFDLIVLVKGPGKLLEIIRSLSLTNIEVLNYRGRMTDDHPTVIVKKNLLMPYNGVRGKGGGLNFTVDLLQFREGFLGSGERQDPTPERMLFGIFDARHQPHPSFWKHVLPKFMKKKEIGFSYEVNNEIIMVQAPQSFATLITENDVLDVMNGMSFNIMNVIRNRCGGVTSCGTNAVWQVNAEEFSRRDPDSVMNEYFDSRTKIEDTASTHIHFCKGKRSVYVHEKVCTGVAKVNADYLGAVQRWAEGAVQLFWIQLFVDRTRKLVVFSFAVLVFMGFIYTLLYGPWTKELIGYNLFCDVSGEPTLFLGLDSSFCTNCYDLFSTFLGHTIDKIIFQMAEADYMKLIDVAISWFVICCFMAFGTMILAWRGAMPQLVRVFIMYENITYFWTSCSMFFWMALTLFMITGMTPPLMFNVTHFMMFILCINVTQHCMIDYYKSMGGCNELSIWRSQQSYTISAPLYIMAIIQGTTAAWGIAWRRLDKSFWNANDHGVDVIRGVTIWVTFIWSSFIFCIIYTVTIYSNGGSDYIARNCQLGGLFMLMLLAVTVWEPFLTVWGLDKSIDNMSADKERGCARAVARFFVWWRSRAWIIRYILDFGMPLVIISGMTGGVSILTIAAYTTSVQVTRT